MGGLRLEDTSDIGNDKVKGSSKTRYSLILLPRFYHELTGEVCPKHLGNSNALIFKCFHFLLDRRI